MRFAIAVVTLATATAKFADPPAVGQDISPASPPLGLYVRDGVLMREGKPYLGVGANYFSLFSRILQDPNDTSSLANLVALRRAGVPFVRFMGCGFWPADNRLYLADREEFFRRLDRVVLTAEASRIGLIPSLFWHTATVPDMMNESLDQLGVDESRSIEFIRHYTEDVVQRYRTSPAIWAWEFGNEYNLGCDLPNGHLHRPPIVPRLGTADKRTERDELKIEQLQVAFDAFARSVRKWDARRAILTGNSIPRESAYHNRQEGTWTSDTREQFAEILRRDNPDPFDTITVHTYYRPQGGYPGPSDTIDGMLAACAAEAARAKKPLFVGEFGASRELGDKERAVFNAFLDGIVRYHIPLAAFWVFDFGPQDKDYNITLNNGRAYMIRRIGEVNRTLSALK